MLVCTQVGHKPLELEQVSFGAANANKFFNNKQPDRESGRERESTAHRALVRDAMRRAGEVTSAAWHKVDPSPTHKLCALCTLKNKLALGPASQASEAVNGKCYKNNENS